MERFVVFLVFHVAFLTASSELRASLESKRQQVEELTASYTAVKDKAEYPTGGIDE